MRKLSIGLLLTTAILSHPVFGCTKDGSEGFLPENNLSIPAGDKSANTLSETQFNKVIDEVEEIYAPIVATYGGKLKVVRNWTDGTVNAYAERFGDTWKVSMFGGLARHKTITDDGFRLVICHEIGHHIGGVPRYADDDWASNEGQSDYFATTKCLRRIWQGQNNADAIKDADKFLIASCAKHWSTQEDRDICVRAGMAGDSVAKLFSALSWQTKPAKFETPDSRQVSKTNDSHPATQCRLDTYFQGALCQKSFSEEMGQEDEVSGVCHGSLGMTVGLRPRCWFMPTAE